MGNTNLLACCGPEGQKKEQKEQINIGGSMVDLDDISLQEPPDDVIPGETFPSEDSAAEFLNSTVSENDSVHENETGSVTDDEVSLFLRGVVQLQSLAKGWLTRAKFEELLRERENDPEMMVRSDLKTKQLLMANRTQLSWIFDSYMTGPSKLMEKSKVQEFGFMFRMVPLLTNIRKLNQAVDSILLQTQDPDVTKERDGINFYEFLLLITSVAMNLHHEGTMQERLNEVLVVMDGSDGKKKLAAKRNVKAMGRFKTLESHNLPTLLQISEVDFREICTSKSPRASGYGSVRGCGSYRGSFRGSFVSRKSSPGSSRIRATNSTTLKKKTSRELKSPGGKAQNLSAGNTSFPSPGGGAFLTPENGSFFSPGQSEFLSATECWDMDGKEVNAIRCQSSDPIEEDVC